MTKTEQEKFWLGNFGDEYIQRNQNYESIPSRIALFSKIIDRITKKVDTVIEFGANVGFNLFALNLLLYDCELSAVEINENALNILREEISQRKMKDRFKTYCQSILDFHVDYQRNFVLSSGLLIHIDPKSLPKAYEVIYKSSNNYICLAEYYNPKPVKVNYRGHKDRLFKRDFAGEMLDLYKDLTLIDYGFVYHRDTNFPQDDITWFLMKKNN